MNQSGISLIFEKNRDKLKAFLYNFVIVTVFFGGLLRRSYNADTITYVVYAHDDAGVRIRDGRYLIALFDVVLNKLGIKTTDYMPICIFLSFILLAVSMVILQSLFSHFFSSDSNIDVIGYTLAMGLVFSNVLFIEYFMFTEVTLFYVAGYFLATMGVYTFVKNKWVTSYVLFIISVCIYQFAAVYAAVILLFYYMLLNEFEWSKKAVIQELVACAIPMSTGGLSMAAIKIVGIINPDITGRKPFSSVSAADKIMMLIDSIAQFAKDSYTLLFRLYVLGIVFVLSVGLAIYLILKTKGAMGVLYFALVVLTSLMSIFVIPFLGAGFNFPPRMAFCLYLLQGLILVTDMQLLKQYGKETLLKATAYVVIGYAWMQMIACSFITSGRYVSNTLDKVYSRIVLEEIEKYEEETGIAVTKIASVKDGFAPDYYEESRTHYGQINERIMGLTTRTMFEAFWDRHFDAAKMSDEVYDQYFAGKNWDYFDVNEQLVIVDDTAYLCVY